MILTIVLCYFSAAFGALCVWLAEEQSDLMYAIRRRQGIWDAWSVALGAALCWPMAVYFAVRNVRAALRRQRSASEGK